MNFMTFRGGINWQDSPYEISIDQCVIMQNMRHRLEKMRSMPGTIKYHNNSLGSEPITAIMPYHDESTGAFKLLVASGDQIYVRDPSGNQLNSLQGGFIKNSIFSSADRFGVKYISSDGDTIYKFLGGTKIETVGGGDTKPGGFRQVIYMKEIDRLFGIRQNAILGQIGWCDFQDPESWPAENVDRIKLKDGESTEWAEILYGKLVIFNTYSIWIYYVSGNEENWRLEQSPSKVGCVAFKTIKRVGNEIWFLGEAPGEVRGVYAFNGSTTRLLTYDINPLIARINKDRLGDCAAELHDGFYTLSFPFDASTKNNMSVDLDTVVLKEDATPAIYGPHDLGFYSTCVLDGVDNNKEVLYGDQSDGFVYREGGTTFKSTNGIDGTLIRNRFLSGVYNDKSFDQMKIYEALRVYFQPTGFFQAQLRAYLSHGSSFYTGYPINLQASEVGNSVHFSALERRIFGTPDLYEYWQSLGVNDYGTAIQIEIINDNIGQIMEVHGVGYDSRPLYKTRGVQAYVN